MSKTGRDKRQKKVSNNKSFMKKDKQETTNRGSKTPGEEGRSTPELSSGLQGVYTLYPDLIAGAGKLPFVNVPGMGIRLWNNVDENTVYRIPGVAAMEWVPSIGYCEDTSSPANLAAREMWVAVRSAFGGSTLKVAAADLMVYVCALDSYYSYIASCKRIYRTLSAYTSGNLNIPDRLLYAMGLTQADINSLRANKTQLWTVINELIRKSDRLDVPAIMHMLKRHYWINDQVFRDDESISSQLYLFRQRKFFRFETRPTPEGLLASGLTLVEPSYSSPEAILNFGSDLINALLSWEESQTIAGYFRRTYESIPKFMVPLLDQGEYLDPIFDLNALAQIENSRTIGHATLDGTWNYTYDVHQSPAQDMLISTPQVSYTGSSVGNAIWAASRFNTVSVRSTDPSAVEVVDALRFTPELYRLDDGSDPELATYSIYSGTEIPLNWKVFTPVRADRTSAGMVNTYVGVVPQFFSENTRTADPYDILLYNAHVMTQFSWHPQMWMFLNETATEATQYIIPLFDTHNLTVASATEVKNIQRMVLYSELNSFMR